MPERIYVIGDFIDPNKPKRRLSEAEFDAEFGASERGSYDFGWGTPDSQKGQTMSSPVAHSPVAKPDLDLKIERRFWKRIIRSTDDIHLLAYGPPGTGKSYDFRVYADEMVKLKNAEIQARRLATNDSTTFVPIHREETNATRQTAAAMLLGHWIISEHGGFTWNDGPLARAIKSGIPFILNDIHLCSDDLLDLLMFACDSGATWSLPNGEILRHTKGYRALLSMNGVPAEYLDEPLRDRVLAVPINEPSKQAIEALDEDVQTLCKIEYRDIKPGQTPKFSYRTFDKFCAIRGTLGDILGASLACEDQERARAFVEALLVRKKTTIAATEDDEDDD